MTKMRPNPKKKRIELRGKAKEALRGRLWEGQLGRCSECGDWIPLHGGFFGSHWAHGKSRGAGGDDTEKNTSLKCAACHFREHSPRWGDK